MSENTTEAQVQTVQKFRHEAKDALVAGRSKVLDGLARTQESQVVYKMLNGAIENIIAGREGLTQEQQVENLNSAREKVGESLAGLPDAVAAAVTAGAEAAQAKVARLEERLAAAKAAASGDSAGLVEAAVEAASKARSILDEAATFAQERDFDAWQEEKAARRGVTSSDEVEDDSDSEDDNPDF